MSPGHAHSSKRTRIVILVAVVVAALVTGLALLPDTFSADADASAHVTKVSTRPTASGDVGKNLPVSKPKISCTELLRKDFGALDDAATSVASASVVAKGDANAYEYEYCDVKGTVAPQIQFELRLPTKTYRQRYLQEGCGGYCGMVGGSAQPAASTGCAPKNTEASAGAGSTAPTVEYTRPVYPYPQLVAYDGSGDKKDAANYRAYTPDKLPDDHYKWAGSFTSGYQEWCETKDGKSLSCSRHES
ncbi:tannase/feruloyl esterase family alpha/beta hydrolase [Streptomyces sp. NBC_01261]|uniref:tannase/feruloyl esterase family alpha/beta hydrolase n=1 Tax=Streptomyces sp. NBC_01261 TaxID=2903802 RepID=UPI002E33057D|nr:hypothetical protein [Streptomyces sp. NBC_01261]